MPQTAILFGTLLTLLGVGTYVAALVGIFSGYASPTALIPAAFGLLLIACGALAAARPNARKHAMHVAAIVGLLGALAPLGRLVPTIARGGFAVSPASVSQILMIVLCAVFLVLCIRSFVQARRNREAAPGFPVQT